LRTRDVGSEGLILRALSIRIALRDNGLYQHIRFGDGVSDTALLTQHINDVLERWIRAEPGAWLWMHRRWRADVINTKIAASQRNKDDDSPQAGP